MVGGAPGDGAGSEVARRRGPLRVLAGSAVLLALLTACAQHAPQDALRPAGPMAAKPDHLFRSIMWFAVVPVFVVVEGLLLFSVLRHRHRPGRPEPVEKDAPTKLRWVLVPAIVM